GQREGRRGRRLHHQGRALHRQLREALRGRRHQLTHPPLQAAPTPDGIRDLPSVPKENPVSATPLLELRGIDKSFGPVQVLR
ncbi:hypothetical protein F8274_30990, partial [Micromonospora sp. AMSO31t]